MEEWPIVVELLASHDDNLKKVESLAQREIFSIEVPVFNALRDILPFSILSALRRMECWFGKVPTIEHALCLVVLTDYVSCTFNQRNYYRTFENALTAKFVDSLFQKLYEEWSKVFSGRPFIHFTDAELESIRKSLSRSVDRFPESFRHKFLLNHIVHLGGRYRKRLAEKNSENVNVALPIQRPLVSSENLLWKDKYKGVVNSGLKKKSKADMNRYVVKKPVHESNVSVHKESTKYVPVHEESTKKVPVHEQSTKKVPVHEEPTKNVSVHEESTKNVSILEESTEDAPVHKMKKVNDYEDDSMDSVDVYLTRRSVYSPSNHSRCNGDIYSVSESKSLSPVDSFFKEMEQLNQPTIEVIDSDEEKMKVDGDSNYSEISVGNDFNTNWDEIPETDDEKKLKSTSNSKSNEIKMDENSDCSTVIASDEEKMNVDCDYVPQIVPTREKKVNCDYLPKTIAREKKMNNSCPIVVDKEVISVCDCCPIKPKHTSGIPVPVVSAPKKKVNAFDILMRKVAPSKRQRFSK